MLVCVITISSRYSRLLIYKYTSAIQFLFWKRFRLVEWHSIRNKNCLLSNQVFVSCLFTLNRHNRQVVLFFRRGKLLISVWPMKSITPNTRDRTVGGLIDSRPINIFLLFCFVANRLKQWNDKKCPLLATGRDAAHFKRHCRLLLFLLFQAIILLLFQLFFIWLSHNQLVRVR